MKQGQDAIEPIEVLDEFVCRAIPDPSIAAEEKSGSKQPPAKKDCDNNSNGKETEKE